ncbi:hypothetical protein [Proteus mirabilis]|uniref:hypothetical protein n=1 Tax=Proteus mirabilis TaxID=584 RepID=UPI000F5BA1E5|nr:hypothetical protein EHQ54_14485 [Proteus mirabilis]
MKERGIIFNAEMVRAILDGRKTQTRRIVKNVIPDNGIWLKKPTKTRSGTTTHILDATKHNLCPLGKIGDRLYVREAFKAGVCTESTIAYKATHKPSDLEEGWYEEIKWTPSIHMPRKYSRITLEITNIRVERLNDISNDDAKSEGYWYGRGGGVPNKAITPSDQFPTL